MSQNHCNEISGSSNVAGPMWIVDATDLGSLAQGTSDPEEKQKSEAALVATWRNPAGRAGGNLTFSPHNQQIVGDKIYLSNYHGGVIALDATKAFDGVREPRASERPVEVGFKVPDVLEQRPAFQSFTNPVVPFFVAFPLGRPHVWDMVVYKGCILSQDMTGGLYSLRETDSACGARSSAAGGVGGQGPSGSSTTPASNSAARPLPKYQTGSGPARRWKALPTTVAPAASARAPSSASERATGQRPLRVSSRPMRNARSTGVVRSIMRLVSDMRSSSW